ncbi:LytR family transcriptional regulator [Mycobacterium sp. PS03-16]|uniref:LCP family protein n=1 Tax=Mycobacterium sp. PS03-16 TaxID=2559611 RepID=UPI0010738205|nr:LCP family protein [Mycobacterium sp. PS03-16]TFV57182.1 LytR family transcriptional regulator [Mycobacterium sp. PS03-16]
MSDGDNATPDRRRPQGPDSDNEWLTRSPRRTPGAAPWERQPDPEDAADAADSGHAASTGSHTDGGLTVADLIAKMAGEGGTPETGKRRRAEPEPESGRRRRAEPEPEPEAEPEAVEPPAPPTEIIDAIVDPIPEPRELPGPNPDREDTEIIPAAVGAYRDDLPALTVEYRDERPLPVRFGDPAPVIHEAPRRRRRTAMVVGRAAAALLAVLALVLTGGAWQWQSSKNNSLNKVSALDQDSRDIVDPNAQFGDENFLIVGVDSRIGENSDMGAGTTDDAAGARSDTVMLVNIPANRKRVVAVSFPRDLSIDPMECEPWDPQTGAYGPITDPESPMYGRETVYTEYKLNSAYAVGGPKCLVKVVQKLSGLSVNRFMAVDFAGFAKMVDALGGVEVCSTTPLEDYELGTVLPTAGRQMVDGHTALNYVRARQVTTEINGDYGRIKRQQLFLSSLLRSLISKEVFFSLSKLNNVVNMFIDDSYVDNIDTRDLVTLGQSIQGVNAGRISFVTVPTTGYADEWGNETPRTDDMKALFSAIITDSPLPGEKNADNTPVPGTPESSTSQTSTPQTSPAPADEAAAHLVDAVTTAPGDVTVQVSNSTGQDGLGATTADALQQHGFNVTTPDDYPSALDTTTVFFSPGNEEAAATVASSFANPTIESVTGMGDVVQVVLGSDFQSVAAPTPSGSPVQVNVLHGADSTPAPLPEDLNVTNAADTTCE